MSVWEKTESVSLWYGLAFIVNQKSKDGDRTPVLQLARFRSKKPNDGFKLGIRLKIRLKNSTKF